MTEQRKLRVLVLGATGMLGSTFFRVFSADHTIETFATSRAPDGAKHFAPEHRKAVILNIDLESEIGLLEAFSAAKPDVVINCVGIIKQLPQAHDHLGSLAINSMLPHRLAKYCGTVGARLVHFSTDCVFSGGKGQYTENDFSDAYDLYGRTKFLGEVDYGNAITLRTSIIGHELASARSLVDWFLQQSGQVKGFRNAIFSGLPTVEVARVVREFVIPNKTLRGLYHLAVEPINKNELLRLIAQTYSKEISIIPDDKVVIDRSLNAEKFQTATGFIAKSWPELVRTMHEDYLSFSLNNA